MKHKNQSISTSMLAASLVLALTACGGGGGGAPAASNPLPGLMTSGKVVDGYIKNATVTLDTNDNGICEANEPTATSNATGDFSFSASAGKHMICSTGGTDIATNAPFVGQIKAPAGATYVTPLTNIVMENLIAAMPTGASFVPPTAQAITNANLAITTQLGMGAVDLSASDPVSNLSVLQATTAVQQLIAQTTAALKTATGATVPTADNDIYKIVANTVANQISTSVTPVNLAASSVSFASTVVSASVTSLKTANVPGVVSTALNAANTTAIVSASIGNSVQQISTAPNIASLGLMATQAATTGVSALKNTVTANAANVTSLTAGLTNILPVTNVLVNGASAVGGGAGTMKSFATIANAGITDAAIDFGLPVGAPALGNTVSVAFDVSSTLPNDNRSFQIAINGLIPTLTPKTAGSVLSFAVSPTATASIYGRQASGASANVTANAAQIGSTVSPWFTIKPASLTSVGGIQLNIANILSTINGSAGFTGLNLLKGNFNVTIAVNGMGSVTNGAGTSLAPSTFVSVTNAALGATAPITTVSGQGETINVTVN